VQVAKWRALLRLTSAEGYFSAMSIDQMPAEKYVIMVVDLSVCFPKCNLPVPVPRSSIRCGFGVMGARKSFLSRSIRYFACDMSILSSSSSSIGSPYSVGETHRGQLSYRHDRCS
jgi:hypothetical protein